MKKCNRSISRRKVIVLIVCALFAIMLLAGCSSKATGSTKVDEVAAGDATAGLEYIKNNCTKCHSAPDPSAIKPYDEQTGRTFLAGHMVKSGEKDLNNMIAYFFPSK